MGLCLFAYLDYVTPYPVKAILTELHYRASLRGTSLAFYPDKTLCEHPPKSAVVLAATSLGTGITASPNRPTVSLPVYLSETHTTRRTQSHIKLLLSPRDVEAPASRSKVLPRCTPAARLTSATRVLASDESFTDGLPTQKSV